MVSISLLISSLLLFSLMARQLGKVILSRRLDMPFRTGYSYTALKLERNYKIFAYGTLLVIFFVALVSSFTQVLLGNPF